MPNTTLSRSKLTLHSAEGVSLPFTCSIFPGGEPHIRVSPEAVANRKVWIDARIGDAEGWLSLLELIDALCGCWPQPEKIGIFLPYFPGARQDRRERGTGYTLLNNVQMLSQVSAVDLSVVTFDMHSKAGREELHNVHLDDYRDINPTDVFQATAGYVGVIQPDTGAVLRSEAFARALNVPLIKAEKHRDGITGKLSGFSCQPLPQAGTYLIADDICDGGGTFNGLVDWITANDPLGPQCDFHLYVSHGIFSQGVTELRKRFVKIITTDSFPHDPYNDVTYLPLFNIAQQHFERNF